MENNTSKLVDDLENADFFNDVIESNLEMNNLLVESDFMLETAETELQATIKENLPRISDDDNNSILSIDVSEDLFKGLSSDMKFSPIRYTANIASNVNTQYEQPISENVNNILEEFNENLKSYNEVFQQTAEVEDTSDKINEIEEDLDKTLVAETSNSDLPNSKTVNVKHLTCLDSVDEHDYVYEDEFNTTLEVTVSNLNDDDKSSPVETKLKHHDHFIGASENFKTQTIGNDFTIILNTKPTVEQNTVTDEQINFHSEYKSEAQISSVQLDNEFTQDVNVSFDHIVEPELNTFIDQTTSLTTKNEDLQLNDTLSVNIKQEESNEITKEIVKDDKKVIEEYTLNENNNIVSGNLKRPGEDLSKVENIKKKLKFDETSKQQNLNEIIPAPDVPSSSTEINFTQVIFDPEETADHNDPKWSALKDLETNEDYFKSVREQWPSMGLPNPHKTNTTRYVPENIAKVKPHTVTSAENERATSCSQYLDNRIRNVNREITNLTNKLNSNSRYQRRSERFKMHKEIEDLRHLRHEVEKNKEELKHINTFYYNDSQGWNANYLTRSELSELEEQDRIFEFQKTFYKSY